jgi:hypothetical protein
MYATYSLERSQVGKPVAAIPLWAVRDVERLLEPDAAELAVGGAPHGAAGVEG